MLLTCNLVSFGQTCKSPWRRVAQGLVILLDHPWFRHGLQTHSRSEKDERGARAWKKLQTWNRCVEEKDQQEEEDEQGLTDSSCHRCCCCSCSGGRGFILWSSIRTWDVARGPPFMMTLQEDERVHITPPPAASQLHSLTLLRLVCSPPKRFREYCCRKRLQSHHC